MFTFSANATAEARLLRFSAEDDRIRALETFSGKVSGKKMTPEGRLKEVRDKQDKTSVEVADAYDKKRKELEKGRSWWKGHKNRKGNLTEKGSGYEKGELAKTLDAEFEARATKKVEEAAATAGSKALNLKDAAQSSLVTAGKSASRKLDVATVKAAMVERFIADQQKEIEFLAQEEAGLRMLAEKLGSDSVTLDELKQVTVLREAGVTLLEKVTADKAALEKKEYPDDALATVQDINTRLVEAAVRADETGLYGLENDIYAAATDGKASGKLLERIDKMPVSAAEKKILKNGVAKLTGDKGIKAAARKFFGDKIRTRAENVGKINEKATLKDRLAALNENGERHMKVEINVQPFGNRKYEVAATKVDGRYVMLQGSDGTFASIDMNEDGGKLYLTYKKTPTSLASCIALNATVPAPSSTDDSTTVLLSTEAPPAPATAP